jgi:hypothetical protein
MMGEEAYWRPCWRRREYKTTKGVDKVAKVGDAEKSEVEVSIKIKQNLCSSRDFLSMSCFANFLHTGSSLGPKE